MKKLKLSVETLAVESFDTAWSQAERGTIEGHSGTCSPESCDYWCPSLRPSDCCTADPTCPASCQNTCQQSCDGTCNGGLTCGPGWEDTGVYVCPY